MDILTDSYLCKTTVLKVFSAMIDDLFWAPNCNTVRSDEDA